MKKYLITGLAVLSIVLSFGQGNYLSTGISVRGPVWAAATTDATINASHSINSGGIWFFGGIISNRNGSGPVQFNNTATYANASATGYIDGAGAIAGTGDFTLPLGNASASVGEGVYHPIAFTSVTFPSVISVNCNYMIGTTPTPTLGAGVNKIDPTSYWTIGSVGIYPGTVTVSLTIKNETGILGGNIYVAGFNTNTSVWEKIGVGTAITGAGQVLVSNTGITLGDYSAFTAAGDVPDVIVNITALLQGPLSGSTMSTTLNTLNKIPAAQPYTAAPFGAAGAGYAGTETEATMPATATDWVLVEMRDAITPTTILATRAALILSNGKIVDLNGVSGVNMGPVTTTNGFYVAVRHRNHLGVMSSTSYAAGTTSATYDFSTTGSFGTNGQMLSAGVYAMWAGDVNQDGFVKNTAATSDRNIVIANVSNYSGNTANLANYGLYGPVYDVSDVNLDGYIKNTAAPSDRNIIISNVSNYPGNTANLANYGLFKTQLP